MKTKSITTIPAREIESVVIYADGACPNNGKADARMYCSFAVYVNQKLVHAEKVDLSDLDVKQTNNTAEFHALIEALTYMSQA
ncbi:MAG: RNase H family protein, partial [Anaerolineaceae bacterium]